MLFHMANDLLSDAFGEAQLPIRRHLKYYGYDSRLRLICQAMMTFYENESFLKYFKQL